MHCDLDTFFVSVERLLDPGLAGRPVLIGGTGDRGVVASCSYEARRYGVHNAMPMRLARQLCPEARMISGNHEQYSRYSRLVTGIIRENAPVVEKASIDEHYIDVSGMDRFLGCWKWSRELRRKIMKETGLPISFGLSVNKTVSKIATGEAKPCGERYVADGTERSFLAPLSVRRIPMIGEKTYRQLCDMGVTRIAALQELPPAVLERTFGHSGLVIWRKANGIDDSPVIPYSERKSISKEHTFGKDTVDMALLRKSLCRMSDDLAFLLRREGKQAGCLALKIRYSNFDTYTRQVKLPYTSSEKLLSRRLLELFDALYNRRLLIRLVGVRLSSLVAGSCQTDLFEDRIAEANLTQAADRIRDRYGGQAIRRGICL